MRPPPIWMTVNVRTAGGARSRHFRAWFPLFIIGPLFILFLLAVAVISLPFVFLAWLFTWQGKWWRWLLHGLPGVVGLSWSLSGLRVDVHDGDSRVYVSVV